VSLGDETRAINFMATGIVVGLLVMLVPTLARLDRRAPAAVALVAGGGLGNLVSLGASPRGVPDFLAVRAGEGWWALNVADVALAVGLVMLGRTVLVLGRLVRRHGGRTPVVAATSLR
jgi:lipoprotein signal peptidase